MASSTSTRAPPQARAENLRDESPAVLQTMGLRLSDEKTRIVHIDEGFDFLGFRIQRQQKLLITVPDMPKVIRDARLRLDPGVTIGVPEHVTAMYPFLHPDDVGETIVDRLEKICSETAGFEFAQTEVQWFGKQWSGSLHALSIHIAGSQCWSKGNSAHGRTAVRMTRSHHT